MVDTVGVIKGLDKHTMPRSGDVMVPASQIQEQIVDVGGGGSRRGQRGQPLPPERVAERLVRIDALLAQVSEEKEEEEEASTEDFDLDAQPSLEQSMEILKFYAQKMGLSEVQSPFRGCFRPTRFCRYFSVVQCWMGSSCTFAHAYDELHPDSQY